MLHCVMLVCFMCCYHRRTSNLRGSYSRSTDSFKQKSIECAAAFQQTQWYTHIKNGTNPFSNQAEKEAVPRPALITPFQTPASTAPVHTLAMPSTGVYLLFVSCVSQPYSYSCDCLVCASPRWCFGARVWHLHAAHAVCVLCVCLSICVSVCVCLSVCVSVCVTVVCVSVCLCAWLCVYVSVRLVVCLCVCVCVYLRMCACLCLFVCLCVCLLVRLCVCPCVGRCVCVCVCRSVCVCACVPMCVLACLCVCPMMVLVWCLRFACCGGYLCADGVCFARPCLLPQEGCFVLPGASLPVVSRLEPL